MLHIMQIQQKTNLNPERFGCNIELAESIDRIDKWRLCNDSFVFVFIIFKGKILLNFIRANEL